MTVVTHNTAETQFVEGAGVRYAYRELGSKAGIPLLFCHRFRGTMDDWDPAVVDGIAARRRVILFDNAGVGLSSGEVPNSVRGMADHVAQFARLMKFVQVDLLGFSLGGYVAQSVTLEYPQLVRKVVLAGTGPGGGEGILRAGPESRAVSGRPALGLDEFLILFFSPSQESVASAKRYWERVNQRGPHREPPLSQVGIDAQVAAITQWTIGNGSVFPRLSEIKQPVLVTNGSADIMVPTVNSFLMAQKLQNGLLIIYPDSGHGFLFQYPEEFTRDLLNFIES